MKLFVYEGSPKEIAEISQLIAASASRSAGDELPETTSKASVEELKSSV